MYINGQGYVNHAFLEKTLYLSPLMVMTEQEYTKHYFIEGERVATKIGSGFTNIPFRPFEEPPGGYQFDPNDKAEQLHQLVSRDIECVQYEGELEINTMLEPAYFESQEYEPNQYFYHPDHLGSSSFITNAIGYAEQHLQYLPFGESFIDQRNGYSSRYTFSAKEKDDETQYSYFGARYYDSDLSVWLSVDPAGDIYPAYSGYMYALGNPVRYVDPNGMWVEGAGFFNNIFKSDTRNRAEMRVNELKGMGIDANARKDKESGDWTVSYKSNENVDFGDGSVTLNTFNVENFDKDTYIPSGIAILTRKLRGNADNEWLSGSNNLGNTSEIEKQDWVVAGGVITCVLSLGATTWGGLVVGMLLGADDITADSEGETFALSLAGDNETAKGLINITKFGVSYYSRTSHIVKIVNGGGKVDKAYLIIDAVNSHQSGIQNLIEGLQHIQND
jgi:RHS repeat-associated protein